MSSFYSWLNLASVLFGIIALVLPIFNLTINYKKVITFSVLSMIFCIISIWFQIVYNHYLVKVEDWTGLMDTTGTLVWGSAILALATIVLNSLSLIIDRKKLEL